MTHPPGPGDRGSGTVLVLGIVGAAIVVATVLAALATAQGARGRAQTAADLGALAAATALRHGEDACEVAADAVRRNGADLVECLRQEDGVVRVETRYPLGVGVLGAVLGDGGAWARAGPATVVR